MSIAENIKRLRQEAGMSQAEFGAMAGVTDKAVSTWETGKKAPRQGAIQKIADYFQIPISDIYGDAGAKPASDPDEALKFALFGEADVDDETFEEVKRFARFSLEQKRRNEN